MDVCGEMLYPADSIFVSLVRLVLGVQLKSLTISLVTMALTQSDEGLDIV